MKAGQAFIGDWREAGLKSEKAYRHAKEVLSNCKLATFQGANKGTVATLADTRVFSLSADSRGEQTGGPRDSQGADKGRTRGEQGASNNTENTETRFTMDTPPPPPCDVDVPGIVALWPKRGKVHAACLHVLAALNEGVDPEVIRNGTRAMALAAQQAPGGCLNIYVPGAEAFFEKRRWMDDPQTLLRTAANHQTGAPPETPRAGGRSGTIIRITPDLGGRRPGEVIDMEEPTP